MADRRSRCPVCGAYHARCGGSETDTVQPVDIYVRSDTMAGGPLKRYKTDKTILKLNDRDAERLGLKKPAKADDEETDTNAAAGRRRATSKTRPAPAAADTE